MSSMGIRTWLLVGAGFGLLAAIMVVLFNATVLGLLLEAIFAIAAGALTVYLNRGMVVPTAPPPSGGPPVSARGFWARQGALAGATVGVLGGIAYTIVASALINGSPHSRRSSNRRCRRRARRASPPAQSWASRRPASAASISCSFPR